MSEPDRPTGKGRWRDVRPWELPGNVRRDAAPHRGLLLFLLGGAALVCGFLAVLLAVPALVALPLGLAVRRMAEIGAEIRAKDGVARAAEAIEAVGAGVAAAR